MSVRDDQLDTLKVDGKDYEYYRIADLPGIDHLPYSLKVLAENLVRNIDGANITDDHVKALLDWNPAAQPSHEIQFTPSRVVMQDFTGVPRSNKTWTSNTSATANVTSSCVGVSRHSRTSAWYRRERASSTRSISNISPRSS